ncbi:hypothetical protein NSMM_400034 [Nitrosomonas mobilis]|uniref:Uncharacterized protein n=1 Tax=Nitrosomonas mobilis TaxID=51642 RepID=A0A1G5SED0_9PROT|nr:hypothetical protein NSMM_400034 [Nitrosomonas mobilis]
MVQTLHPGDEVFDCSWVIERHVINVETIQVKLLRAEFLILLASLLCKCLIIK